MNKFYRFLRLAVWNAWFLCASVPSKVSADQMLRDQGHVCHICAVISRTRRLGYQTFECDSGQRRNRLNFDQYNQNQNHDLGESYSTRIRCTEEVTLTLAAPNSLFTITIDNEQAVWVTKFSTTMCSVTEVNEFFGGFSQERGRSSPKQIKQEVTIQNIPDVDWGKVTNISPNVPVIIQQNHWVVYSFTVVYGNMHRTSEPHDDRHAPRYHMRSRIFGRPTPTLRRTFNYRRK